MKCQAFFQRVLAAFVLTIGLGFANPMLGTTAATLGAPADASAVAVGAPAGPLTPLAPEALRCPGLDDPGPQPAGYMLQATWGWVTFGQGDVVRAPVALALDHSCNLYVANASGSLASGAAAIVKLDRHGTRLAEFKLAGLGPTLNYSPTTGDADDLAVDSAGNMYASTANVFQKLSPSGDLLALWGNKWVCDTFRVTRATCNTLKEPGFTLGAPGAKVAVDGSNTLFAVSSERGFMLKYAPDGNLIKSWGSSGKQPGQLFNPQAVAVGPDGSLYVVETWSNRVSIFSSSGEFRTALNGGSDGVLTGPSGVAVDLDGNVYIADTNADRVLELSPKGDVLKEWGKCFDDFLLGRKQPPCRNPSPGRELGEFQAPARIAVDGLGEIFVADAFNKRVQVYKLTQKWVPQPPAPQPQPQPQPAPDQPPAVVDQPADTPPADTPPDTDDSASAAD